MDEDFRHLCERLEVWMTQKRRLKVRETCGRADPQACYIYLENSLEMGQGQEPHAFQNALGL
jgi:hypothetical protein